MEVKESSLQEELDSLNNMETSRKENEVEQAKRYKAQKRRIKVAFTKMS